MTAYVMPIFTTNIRRIRLTLLICMLIYPHLHSIYLPPRLRTAFLHSHACSHPFISYHPVHYIHVYTRYPDSHSSILAASSFRFVIFFLSSSLLSCSQPTYPSYNTRGLYQPRYSPRAPGSGANIDLIAIPSSLSF